MRCPVCSSPLREGAVKCDECGCGILPPPPAGTEPTPFVRPATTPKWPLILSIVGVIAAVAVIAVALLPLFGDDDDDDVVQTATTALTDGTDAEASTSVPSATTVATTEATAATDATATSTTEGTSTTTGSTSTTEAEPTTTVERTSTTAGGSTSTASTAPSTTVGAAFPSPVSVSLVEATCTAPDSTDSRGNPITFNPLLTIDGRDDTAWRCPGASIRQALVYTLARPADVSAVAALPGYAGEDPFNGIDRFDQNRRVTRARWGCLSATGADVASVEQVFDDRRSMQGLTLTGFDDCAKVVFEILDTTAPGNRDYAAVSEIGIYGPG